MSDVRTIGHGWAIGVALVVTLLWSSSWVLIRWGLDDEALEPVSFAALRYGAAAVVLLMWVAVRSPLRRSVRDLSRHQWILVISLGIVFYTVTQGAQFVAIDHQPAATTSLVLALTPVVVAVGAMRARREPPTTVQLAGALLIVAGAWLFFAGDLGATVVGMVAAVVALAANSGSAILGRTVNREGPPPTVVTALSMTVGVVGLAAVALLAEGVPAVSPRAWLIIGWLALVNTALAFSLWNLSLRRLSAFESSAINNTMLIQIAVLAWVFLSEPPGAAGAVGVALVTAGILLTQLRESSWLRRSLSERRRARSR